LKTPSGLCWHGWDRDIAAWLATLPQKKERLLHQYPNGDEFSDWIWLCIFYRSLCTGELSDYIGGVMFPNIRAEGDFSAGDKRVILSSKSAAAMPEGAGRGRLRRADVSSATGIFRLWTVLAPVRTVQGQLDQSKAKEGRSVWLLSRRVAVGWGHGRRAGDRGQAAD
jgi:hypothetical protein